MVGGAKAENNMAQEVCTEKRGKKRNKTPGMDPYDPFAIVYIFKERGKEEKSVNGTGQQDSRK